MGEAAADAVDAMLQKDASATVLLAQIHAAHDEGRLESEPAVAALLLGVQEGCSRKESKAAWKNKFEKPLSKLQDVGRQDVEQAMKLLEIAEETVVRGTRLWTPAGKNAGVAATRALGCKDLKKPVALLGVDLSVEVAQLDIGESAGLVLITEGAEHVSDAMIARHMAEHSPVRPRAAALRIAADAEAPLSDGGARRREAVSVVCAFMHSEPPPGSMSTMAKRQRTEKADRVRVSHVLLRWADMKNEDEFQRPDFPPPTRSQAEAERTLLEMAEELLRAGQPKTLKDRFKAKVLKHSECSTALNVPHADLGWVEPGGAEPPLEMAAFDIPVGGLSDVVVTSRGAHLMYRLA